MTPFEILMTVLALAPVVLYAIAYAVSTTWYRTLMGAGQFIDKTSLAMLLLLATLTAFLGADWPGRGFVRAMIYGLLIGGQWAALAAFYITYRRARRANREDSL